MLTCKETSLLVSQSLDRRLTWSERLAVGLHLWLCRQCRRFVRQMRWLRSFGRHLADEPEIFADVEEALPTAARRRIRQAIEACHPASSQGEGDRDPRRDGGPRNT